MDEYRSFSIFRTWVVQKKMSTRPQHQTRFLLNFGSRIPGISMNVHFVAEGTLLIAEEPYPPPPSLPFPSPVPCRNDQMEKAVLKEHVRTYRASGENGEGAGNGEGNFVQASM
jgi:hypothetical protein